MLNSHIYTLADLQEGKRGICKMLILILRSVGWVWPPSNLKRWMTWHLQFIRVGITVVGNHMAAFIWASIHTYNTGTNCRCVERGTLWNSQLVFLCLNFHFSFAPIHFTYSGFWHTLLVGVVYGLSRLHFYFKRIKSKFILSLKLKRRDFDLTWWTDSQNLDGILVSVFKIQCHLIIT